MNKFELVFKLIWKFQLFPGKEIYSFRLFLHQLVNLYCQHFQSFRTAFDIYRFFSQKDILRMIIRFI